jgi:hypothetical protein
MCGLSPRPWTALALGLALLLPPAAAARAGTLTALSYNVAGLPTSFGGEGEVNNVFVSPLLNGYDLVAVQEDFFFHDDLTHAVDYPYVSEKDTSGIAGSGDGLLRLSESPFTDFERVPWVACFGTLTNASDCLTPKGFSAARHELEPGVFLDVYNLHAEAGGEAEDLDARRQGLRQLVDFAEVYSAGNAVLILGDTNSRWTRDGDILPEVISDLALTDVWVELERGGVAPGLGPSLQECDDPTAADCERVDKVFYRGSAALGLTALSYEVPEDAFVDADGLPLSDHEPVVVSFAYRVPEAGRALLAGLAALSLAGTRRAGLSAARRRPASRRRGSPS